MCCFSRAVPFVGQTRIFARALPDRRQALVYAMKVDVLEELAMVLPLPVPVGSPEDAVEFVDLSGYPTFFTDVDKAFPDLTIYPQALGVSRGHGAPPPRLRVVEVGAFEASFVPRIADFSRLDERFRMPRSFFDALPMYADHGFAVFRLKPVGRAPRVDVHPMAFRFPRRDETALFFPTVHVHDGTVPEQAAFDHKLTAQPSPLVAALLGAGVPGGWTPSKTPLGLYVDAKRDHGLTDPTNGGFQLALMGSLPNRDTWLREPAGLTLSDLSGRGHAFQWELRGTAAFAAHAASEPHATWHHTARTRLPELARAMGAGIEGVVKRLSGQLTFAPLSDAMEPHFMNGRQLWTGTNYMNGARGHKPGPGYVHFTPFTKKVEPQSVLIGFAKMPDQEGAELVLHGLEEMLDRALP